MSSIQDAVKLLEERLALLDSDQVLRRNTTGLKQATEHVLRQSIGSLKRLEEHYQREREDLRKARRSRPVETLMELFGCSREEAEQRHNAVKDLKKFIVVVPEVHNSTREVWATNEEEAIHDSGGGTEISLDYVRDLEERREARLAAEEAISNTAVEDRPDFPVFPLVFTSEKPAKLNFEDCGAACIIEITDPILSRLVWNEGEDAYSLFLRIQSWDGTKDEPKVDGHPLHRQMEGKRLRVTVELLEEGAL